MLYLFKSSISGLSSARQLQKFINQISTKDLGKSIHNNKISMNSILIKISDIILGPNPKRTFSFFLSNSVLLQCMNVIENQFINGFNNNKRHSLKMRTKETRR